MLVIGCVLSFLFFVLFVNMAGIGGDVGGAIASLFMLQGSIVFIIVGGCKLSQVRRYNRRIKAMYLASLDKARKDEQKQNEGQQITAVEEIERYYRLLQSGAITQDEFEAKKHQLLNL